MNERNPMKAYIRSRSTTRRALVNRLLETGRDLPPVGAEDA